MKNLAVVAVVAAMLAAVGLASTGGARTSASGEIGSGTARATEGETYAMSIGRPVELTEGERQNLKSLLPSIDPATVPPEKIGKVRAILYGTSSDAEKRNLIQNLMR